MSNEDSVDRSSPRQYSVMLAKFPGNQQEHPRSSSWLTETSLKIEVDDRICRVDPYRFKAVPFQISDTPITMCRNLAVKMALDRDIDYLLMIDSDMKPDTPLPGARPFWDTVWEFMMARRQAEEDFPNASCPPATVGAPYCGPPPHEHVYVFHWTTTETDSASPHFNLTLIPRETAAICTGIQEVAALPTGLILYDMRVFRQLPPPWFCYSYTDKYQTAKSTTEDVYQTRNASMLKLPQFCAWDSWASHMKIKEVVKPKIVTRDQVCEEMRDAIVRAWDSGTKLGFVDAQPSSHVHSWSRTYAVSCG